MRVESEDGRLIAVGVASPALFHVTSPINARQTFEFSQEPIDHVALISEHMSLVAALRKHGVRVVEIEPHPLLPYILNVRDSLVVVGNHLVGAAMGRSVRHAEPFWIAPQLGAQASVRFIETGRLEGGDVLVLDRVCFVGISERTDPTGAGRLAEITARQAVLVLLEPGVLHLDTVLNVIGDVVVLAPELIGDAGRVIDELAVHGIRDVIEVSSQQAWELEPNFLALDPQTVLLGEGSVLVASALESRGLRVIRVPMDQHHRIGGSVRCATLPLDRAIA